MASKRRSFPISFKRQVVEELLSQTASLAQLSRRYEISPGVILHWKQRYEMGKLLEGPSTNEKALAAKVAELERMVGKLTMENDLLKKAMEYTLRRRREDSSPITAKNLEASKGGAE